MTTYCDIERQVADPRYAYREDSYAPDAPLWPPGCGHAVCLAEIDLHQRTNGRECSDPTRTGWECPVAVCVYSTPTNQCDLPAGHVGDHLFAHREPTVAGVPS